ncbi:MAG TPA: molybdenum cofactor synthesis domain-containing protein [Actinomycetota bacterium]|nr:molybdenum cofactor synthesis domain-containing protein [Actinomycetota bacterium]
MGKRGAAIVTVSDGVAQGVREDASGRAVSSLLESSGFHVGVREVVADERDAIEQVLVRLCERGLPLVVTTGGTGLGPRDVTPEATRAVIDREAPGLAEQMRAAGRDSTLLAALSRGVAGSRGSTLILNLPGSEKGAVESLSSILPVLPHALDLLAGDTVHGPTDHDDHDDHRSQASQTGRSGNVDEELATRRAAGEEVVLATAVKVEGNPPCQVGQKLLLGPDGSLAGTLGCAEFDDAAIADTADVLRARRPTTRRYSHDLGAIEVFVEPVLRRPLLVVFSATPVALSLVRWAREIGYEPVLIEPRPERITEEHRSSARTAPSLEGLALDAEAMAVHTDHDAPNVTETAAELLRSPVGFIGVMGSARHVGPHIERLRDLGFGEEDIARIRTPVGLDIGARSAQEIALSILAGLVAERHGASGGWLDRR